MKDLNGNWPSFNDIFKSITNTIKNVVNTIIKNTVKVTIAVIALVGINYILKHPTTAAIISNGAASAGSQVTKQSSKISKAVNGSKKVINTFPKNPNEFNPSGLKKLEINTNTNGRIIKWIGDSKKALFEWNEDLQYGEHYHITPDGKNRILHPITGNTHINPGDSIPDDFILLFK